MSRRFFGQSSLSSNAVRSLDLTSRSAEDSASGCSGRPASTALQATWWQALAHTIRGRSQFAINIFTNAGSNSLNAVLQLLLLLALGRLLPEAIYAAWITAGAIVAIGEVGSDFGTRLWAVRRFAGQSSASETLLHSLVNKLFYTLSSIIVLSLLPLNTLSHSALLVTLLIAATQPGSDPFLWYLRGKERLDVEAGLVLAGRLLTVITVATAAWMQVSLNALLITWLACNLARMGVASRMAFSRPLYEGFAEVRLKWRQISRNISDVFPIGISLTLAPVFANSMLLFVTIYGTSQDVALFGTAFKLTQAAGLLATSIVVSSFARLAKAVQSGDDLAAQKIVRLKLLLITAALTPVCVLGTFVAVPVSGLILKPELAGAGQVIVMLMPGLFLTCVNMAAKFTLNAYALNRQDVLAMVVGFVVFATTFGVTAPLWLPLRAALGWAVSELTVLFTRWWFLRRQNRHHGWPVAVILSCLSGLILLTVAAHHYLQSQLFA